MLFKMILYFYLPYLLYDGKKQINKWNINFVEKAD